MNELNFHKNFLLNVVIISKTTKLVYVRKKAHDELNGVNLVY